MTAMRLKRYPSSSGGFALGKMGVGATLMSAAKTAKDYVQDGLVAMWDGIENAGWGAHDANATVWKDLIGNLDITLPSADSFADNHLVHVSGNPQSSIDTRICEGANITVESVFKASSDGVIYTCNSQAGSGSTSNASGFGQYSLRYQAAGNPSYARFSQGNGTSLAYSLYNATPTPIGEVCSLAHAVNFDPGSKSYSYLNGILDAISSFAIGPVAYTVVGKMRIFTNQACDGYCLRIYNRALTASEIAANYAIDKERFNLP